MALASGTRLGPYEVVEPLGAGGMGEVYRARDPRLGREVAVKLIATEGAPSPDRLRRFETEARAAAALSHPNVVTVFDVGSHEGHPYLVLELLEGETLRETLRSGVPALRQAVTWALEVSRGLGAAHERGIVHRDLKPENVFLTKDGRVKVLDFGLAKLHEPLVSDEADREGPTATRGTSPGVLLGTIGYMSPEQVKGETPDPRTDVFALGTVLYEMVAGRRAFGGGTAPEVLASILRDEPPALESQVHAVPASLETVVRRCLGKHPGERFSSARELAGALEAVLASLEPTRATGARPLEPRGPYPGLSSFTEADAGRFFGREAEVESLWGKLRQRKLLALIGPSGAGKTSFVQAGLVSSRPSGWGVIVATPGSAPMRSLAQALVEELPSDAGTMKQLLAFDDPDVAFSMVRKWRESHLETVLVVDQFEELFTLNPPEVQERFAELLGRLVGEGDVHVLLSLRDDFLIRCHEQRPLESVFQNLTPILALGGEDLRRALTEPAKKEGFAFEDEALVEEMLESVEGARGALPLLAFAVARLWEKRDREKKLLTRKAYGEIGGVAGSLAQHAEQTLERIGLEREPIVRELFRNLVTAQWTRAVANREELLSVVPDQEAAGQVLDALIDARLLTSYEVRESGAKGPEDTRTESRHRIEIVHESLLRAWPRLVRWQAQDEEGAVLRDQLKQAAHLWEEKSRSPDLLWSGDAFQEFELWRRRYPGKLTALEDEFAEAMAHRARRRKRVWRTVAASTIVALLAVLTVIGGLWRRAVTEARRAEASKLLALAEVRLDDDPTEALALTTASLELADTEDARFLLLRVLSEAPPAFEVSIRAALGVSAGAAAVVSDMNFSPDRRWLATGGGTGDALVWPDTGEGPLVLPGHEPGPSSSIFFGWPDPRHLVTGVSDRRMVRNGVLGRGLAEGVHVWSMPSGAKVRTIEFGGPTSWSAGTEGRLLAATVESEDGAGRQTLLLRSWTMPDGEAEILGRADARVPPGQAAFEPRGRGWIFARDRELYFRPFLAGVGEPDRLLGRHREGVEALFAWRDTLISCDRGGEFRIWSFPPEGPRLERVLRRPVDAPRKAFAEPSGHWVHDVERLWNVTALPGARPLELRRRGSWRSIAPDFSPGGTWLVFPTQEGSRLTFWPLARARPSVVEGYAGVLRPLAFSPDSRWLAATSWSGRELGIRLWSLPGKEGGAVRRLTDTGACFLTFDPRGQHVVRVGREKGREVELVPLDDSPALVLDEPSDADSLYGGVAVSPSGRQVATAFFYGTAEPKLRVWDVETGELRLFALPPPVTVREGWRGGVLGLHFTDESTLYTAGDGGLRRWNLDTGSHELVWAPKPEEHLTMSMSAEGHVALTRVGRFWGGCHPLELHNLETGEHRSLPEYGTCVTAQAIDPSGRVAATGDRDGVVRVSRISGGAPHLLVGHEGPIDSIAVSPDLKWVGSTGHDETLRLWPMPDLDKPPLHTLPHDELIAKLESLTNLRAVRDPESSTGWTIELGPFPGWADAPMW